MYKKGYFSKKNLIAFPRFLKNNHVQTLWLNCWRRIPFGFSQHMCLMKTKVECLRALASTYSAPHHTSSNSSHFWFSECTIWKILSLVGSHTTLSYFLGREFRLMCAHNKWRISGSEQEIGFLGIFYLSKNELWNRDFFGKIIILINVTKKWRKSLLKLPLKRHFSTAWYKTRNPGTRSVTSMHKPAATFHSTYI